MTFSAAAKHIRIILENRPNISTKEVLDILANRNIPAISQYIYTVRSTLKKEREEKDRLLKKEREEKDRLIRERLELRAKTAATNEKTLAEVILEVLEENPEGLITRQLGEKVLEKGYVSHSTNFQDVLRNKLYDIVDDGRVSSTEVFGSQGKIYKLSVEERQARAAKIKEQPVQKQVPPVAAVQQVQPIPENPLPEVNNVEVPVKTLLDPDILLATIDLCSRVDGPKNLQPYLDILSRIEAKS